MRAKEFGLRTERGRGLKRGRPVMGGGDEIEATFRLNSVSITTVNAGNGGVGGPGFT